MKMKYFRFLYAETKRCFLHFGELQDTAKGETFTFLYLRKVERHANQTDVDRRPFLFPEHLDLVVLGSADEETACALKELIADRTVGMLILSGQVKSEDWERVPGIKELVRLGGGTFHTESAGWSFLAKSYEDGTVAMAHGLSAVVQENLFEDCVMSVKALREGLPCQKELSPDSYGCALGCALYQDYDVCKYRESREGPGFRTGTLLFGGGEDVDACRGLLREAEESVGKIRFFGLASSEIGALGEKPLPGGAMSQVHALREGQIETRRLPSDGFRRYLIGTEDLDDDTIAKLCRDGWYQRPVLLGVGEGICCSGLLKYRA